MLRTKAKVFGNADATRSHRQSAAERIMRCLDILRKKGRFDLSAWFGQSQPDRLSPDNGELSSIKT